MKIYELAKELSVDKEALFFLAKNQGIEVKSIVSNLTSEEEERLLNAFDEAGGKLEPIEEQVEQTLLDKVVEPSPKVKKGKVKKKLFAKFVKKFERNLENYEKVPKKKDPAKVKEVGYQKARTVYQIVAFLVVAILLVCGVSAFRANTQMMTLQKSANASIKVLNKNQVSLSKSVEELKDKVKGLEDKKGEKSESDSKKSGKQTPSKDKEKDKDDKQKEGVKK
ncbi:translation initiation factor IF-2 N-terminal domain-containing protein [Lactococcus paracarnosus]|uniref:Translation initiation factor IF-2 N-terminal domain-containing protein n=1 Tax=Pseudolactococcus paracarnosus TaxID=2749962 RepID=A0ABT0AP17_9LACT|nr:translation initiation factor IF-2 N-terminal domain-containing protein [Lactococcus paracarnosus]MCJ1978310.1 hypothetical protein [Lactococcus paracarnosus]MCJ1984473.1 hypothetical protein [Lactococcus paracarnosus]MCJ1999176.1 hypothetical protein [Lactococcus paracarnosus]